MKNIFLFIALFLIQSLNIALAQAPDTVWVDDDYNAATPGWNTTHFAVIQEGVDAVAKDGVVYVAAGYWSEQVEIQDGKSLIGAGIGLSFTTSIGILNTGLDTESIIKNFTLDLNIEGWTALSLEHAYHVTVENIHLLYRGIILGDAHNNTIRNNLLEEYGSISIAGSSNNIIKGNELRLVRYPTQIWVTENSRNNVIEDNLISGMPGDASCTGIRSVYCSNNIYRNNTTKGFRVHILLTYSNCNIVNGNNISGERYEEEEGGGIVVFNGNNNIIINNKIESVAKEGIILFGASCNNQIQANLIANTDHGISLYYGSNNSKLIYNTVRDSHVGIILDNTSDNLVYGNNLVNSHLAAYDDGNNEWDFGGMGNYWSDYKGNDQNGDGVGDTPQLISPLGNDHFPAMEVIPVITAIEQSMIQDTHLMLPGDIIEVTNDTTISNETRDLFESYVIRTGGKLVLDNVDWNVLAGDIYGPLILVDSGGSLAITNSTIHAMGGTIEARFGSALNIENSELIGLGNWDGGGAITIFGADAVIKDNIIKKSYVGITLNDPTGAQIINNRISEAHRGIIGNSSDNRIEGNTIFDIVSSAINANLSNSTVKNNTFRDIWLKTILSNNQSLIPTFIYNNNFFNCGHSEIHETDFLYLDNRGNYYSDYLDRYPNALEHSEFSGIWNMPYIQLMNNPDIPQPLKNDDFPLMYPVYLDTIVTTPGQPALLSPSINSVITPTDLQIKWNSSNAATSYRLQISDITDFESPIINQGGIVDTVKVVNLNVLTLYNWRVLAENYGVISDWSEVYQFTTDKKLDVEKSMDNEIPLSFALYHNYPNPFNPSTNIHYSLPNETDVTITVYDMLGRNIHELISQKQLAGKHSIQWDGADRDGNTASAGIYFYQLKADDYIYTKKMLLMK